MDVARRPAGKWIIDFGEMTEQEASLYEAPFQYVVSHIKPEREKNRDDQRRTNWWRLGRSGADLKQAISRVQRQLITPRVAKHRFFVWMDKMVLPDSRLVSIARDDDTSFGLIHSRFHELWTLRLGGWHGVGNDPQYTPSLGFETFPFPKGLTPDVPATQYAPDPRSQAIAAAAKTLNDRREAWLNPAELVKRVPEVVPGFPDRLTAVNEEAAAVLKERTLTKLYNLSPAWLQHAHKALDAAVATAYGWSPNLSDEEALSHLLALNSKRIAK
jgi:type II restriction/modification system DNA methylase subunit YeeA